MINLLSFIIFIDSFFSLFYSRGRVIGVLTDRPAGSTVFAEVTRTNDNVYVAVTKSAF